MKLARCLFEAHEVEVEAAHQGGVDRQGGGLADLDPEEVADHDPILGADVGGVFTVRIKESLVLLVPSLTVTVIVAAPV